MESVTIDDLPDPVVEYILSYLSPYRDLKQCMLVSKSWYRHVRAAVKKIQRDFNNAITTMSVEWHHLPAEPGPTISKRYSHSACCSGDSMYVFGGCTTANTTFNDLWRLDLATHYWIRPLATGTYPPPKACATLVCHDENLVLFGGWTHISPYPLHQVWRIFSHLHMYNTTTNRWTQVVTPTSCPAMAGHSATVQGDLMVVFGGLQRQGGEGPFSSSCDVWVLHLKTLKWMKQLTTTPQPLPRYGHSQISVDKTHLLVVGGCGGPNMMFNDIWLLTMTDDPAAPWHWLEMKIKRKEYAAPHLAFHPACKVGDRVVVLSKTQKSHTSPSSLPHLLRAPSRIWVPPRTESVEITEMRNLSRPSEVEHCVNGKKGVLKRQFERNQQQAGRVSSDEEDSQSREVAKKVASFSSSSSVPQYVSSQSSAENRKLPEERFSSFYACSSSDSYVSKGESSQHATPSYASYICSSSSSIPPLQSASQLVCSSASDVPSSATPQKITVGSSTLNPLSSVPPKPPLGRDSISRTPRPALSIRPNARRNRQRQLEGLDRMAQRLRDLHAGAPRFAQFPSSSGHKVINPCSLVTAKNPMCLYVLDISTAVSSSYVSWLPLQGHSCPGPEEIILYSLVLGRGELIMFGGIQKDLNSRQQEGETVPEVVSNSLHFMCAQKSII